MAPYVSHGPQGGRGTAARGSGIRNMSRSRHMFGCWTPCAGSRPHVQEHAGKWDQIIVMWEKGITQCVVTQPFSIVSCSVRYKYLANSRD